LVVAIVGVFLGACAFLPGIVAIILAGQAQQKITGSGGQLTGSGMVTAARVIGIIAIVMSVAVIAVLALAN
jgi:hypothetical protein